MNHSPIIRPKLADLQLKVYDRWLHPEFFNTLTSRKISRDGYTLTVRVTPTGHVIEWNSRGEWIVEATTTPDQGLPEEGRRLNHRFHGEQRGQIVTKNGMRYQVSLQSEVLPPELFVQLHEELAEDGARRGLLFHFRPHNRLGLTPLGLITAENLPDGLSLTTFHTFPDEFAIVKTQSLIEPTGNNPQAK